MHYFRRTVLVRLPVVSNFGGGDCVAGEIHTRAREISRRPDAKGAPKVIPFASGLLEISRARVCVFCLPHKSPSPKSETTRSLVLVHDTKYWIFFVHILNPYIWHCALAYAERLLQISFRVMRCLFLSCLRSRKAKYAVTLPSLAKRSWIRPTASDLQL